MHKSDIQQWEVNPVTKAFKMQLTGIKRQLEHRICYELVDSPNLAVKYAQLAGFLEGIDTVLCLELLEESDDAENWN